MTTAIIPVPSAPYDFRAIDRAPLQPSTKKKYKRELELMLQAGVNPSNIPALLNYSDGLKSSSRQFLKAALACVTAGVMHNLKAGVVPESVVKTQAAIWRLEAVSESITVTAHKGIKAHT